jgi:hypothetical protein
MVPPGFVWPLLQVVGWVAQLVKWPVPLVPAVTLELFELPPLLPLDGLPVFVLLPPPLLEHAVSPSAIAATPASSALPLWTLTGE